MIKAFGQHVATEPFPSTGIKAEVKNGFASIKQKAELQALKVLAGNDKIPTGATVYVPADQFKAPWALRTFEGKVGQFILVPEGMVILVETTGLEIPVIVHDEID